METIIQTIRDFARYKLLINVNTGDVITDKYINSIIAAVVTLFIAYIDSARIKYIFGKCKDYIKNDIEFYWNKI